MRDMASGADQGPGSSPGIFGIVGSFPHARCRPTAIWSSIIVRCGPGSLSNFFLSSLSFLRVTVQSPLWPGVQLGPSRAELDPWAREPACPVLHGTAWVRHWARCICECMNKSFSFFLLLSLFHIYSTLSYPNRRRPDVHSLGEIVHVGWLEGGKKQKG